MAMPASETLELQVDVETLRKENELLRQQVRQLSAQQTVARGAIQEAVQEKEATARIAHQVGVEERATRAAVEVQAGNSSVQLFVQVMNLLLTVLVLFGLFIWLPRALPQAAPTVITSPSGATIVPGR